MSLFSLSTPIFIELLLQTLLASADVFMLSFYCENAVGAIGVASQILTTIILMVKIISSGTIVLISQYLGSRKKERVFEIIGISMLLTLLIGIILSFSFVVFKYKILTLMNLPKEFLKYGEIFLSIVGGFIFVEALFILVAGIARSYGYSKLPMYIGIGKNLLNAIGNYLFIFGPMGIPILGVKGVAISTVVSRIIGLIVLLIILFRMKEINFSFNFSFLTVKNDIKNLFKIGISSVGETASYKISQIVIVSAIISNFGAQAITTRTYILRIMWIIEIFTVSMGIGTKIIIGHLVGAKEIKKGYKLCLKAVRISFLVMIMLTVLVFVFSKQLLMIFTENRNIISTGRALLFLLIFIEPGKAFNLVISNALRGAGDIKFPVLISIPFMWGISVGLSYVLGLKFNLGLIGVWIAFAIDEWVRGIIVFLRWYSQKWINKSF